MGCRGNDGADGAKGRDYHRVSPEVGRLSLRRAREWERAPVM
jgi:hypothetical protein